LKFIKYIKSEYKGWLIGIIMLPFIIGFEKYFSELESISELNNLIIILRILCLTFVASFFVFIMFSGEFGFHEELDGREYEPEDLSRFKRNLKKSLTIYSIALLIWIISILIIIFEFCYIRCLKTQLILYNHVVSNLKNHKSINDRLQIAYRTILKNFN